MQSCNNKYNLNITWQLSLVAQFIILWRRTNFSEILSLLRTFFYVYHNCNKSKATLRSHRATILGIATDIIDFVRHNSEYSDAFGRHIKLILLWATNFCFHGANFKSTVTRFLRKLTRH